MTNRPWLVTGAAGFLGSHLVEQLLARGTPVLAVDDLSCGRLEQLERWLGDARLTFAKLDIRDEAALAALLKQHRPEAAVHLAALHYIPAAMANPALTVSLNVHGTQCVLSACRAAEVPRLWFASTGDVYAPAEAPHQETGTLAPFNIYGLSKLMGEQLIGLEARARPEAAFVVGRLFNLIGPRETNPHILPEILKQLRAQPDAPLRLGNLFPRRDMVPVQDAAAAVIAMVDKATPGVRTCNVATGVDWSMEEVLRAMGEVRGRPLPVEVDPARVRPVERNFLRADVSRLREYIGFTPNGNLHTRLRELLASEKLLEH
ncbi:GDP-mannose 4,6-dehydratase [Myxococcaceae bacterium GXIMD 01537]